jgi:gliding motility-associated-like protein
MKHLMMAFLWLFLATCAYSYPGCIDPIALNYDEDATTDNGTCVYSVGPDPIIIDLNISEEDCQVFDAGILSSYVYEATLVNIGTEAVTYFCLSDFLGTTFNCFNGVSNLAVWIQPGDTITVSGTINSAGTWTAGQGNYFTITSVPNEIITGNNNFVFNMITGVDCEVSEEEPCDTVYITETEFLIDTLYITQNFTDTIYLTETEIIIDTLYLIEYLTDTITQYIIEEVWVDCITGLLCGDNPGYPCLGEGSIYAPNAFTPNNDGINDVWKLVYELDCWIDVEFKIFNRWGDLIYTGYADDFDSYPYWDGSINNGSFYAQDGVYFYQLKGRRSDSPEIIEDSGNITIFR